MIKRSIEAVLVVGTRGRKKKGDDNWLVGQRKEIGVGTMTLTIQQEDDTRPFPCNFFTSSLYLEADLSCSNFSETADSLLSAWDISLVHLRHSWKLKQALSYHVPSDDDCEAKCQSKKGPSRHSRRGHRKSLYGVVNSTPHLPLIFRMNGKDPCFTHTYICNFIFRTGWIDWCHRFIDKFELLPRKEYIGGERQNSKDFSSQPRVWVRS